MILRKKIIVLNLLNSFKHVLSRNISKLEALDGKHLVVFLLKVLFDAASRIIFLGAWVYTINNGQFSAILTILYFYSMTLVYFFTDLIFSCVEKMEKTRSFRNLLGN